MGPDYHSPDLKLSENFAAKNFSAQEPQRDFWHAFNDPILNELVDQALGANHDVKIAIANLREARAVLQGVDANALPSVNASLGAERTVLPQTQAPGSRKERTQNIYTAGVDFNWEISFFGRYSRASESATASVSASAAGIQAAQVSVTAEVARNYFELRGAQSQYQLLLEIIDNLGSVQQLIEAQERYGATSSLEVLRARNLLETTQAQLPMIERDIQLRMYRLAVLTAQQPNALTERLSSYQPLPGLSPVSDIGSPASLLRRRPDVVAAERNLAAATAQIGVAKADWFPDVILSGLLGLNAGKLSLLTKSEAFRYDLGGTIRWNILDFGRIRSRINQSEARTEAALAQYEKTVLLALEETEGALVTYTQSQRQTERLYRASEAATEAARLARARFEAGASDFLNLLDAERQRISSQTQLLQAQTQSASSLVAVYKALGGGWTYQTQQ